MGYDIYYIAETTIILSTSIAKKLETSQKVDMGMMGPNKEID